MTFLFSAEGDAGLDAPHRLMYIQDRALDILCSDRTLPFFSGVCPTRIDLSIFESTPINGGRKKARAMAGRRNPLSRVGRKVLV